MRSLKSRGGLSRGTGFKEVQRNTYIYSRPICAMVSDKVQELAGISFCTTKNHLVTNSSRPARVHRDNEDCSKLIQFYRENNPFPQRDGNPMNLVTGVVADDSVNVFDAVGIGQRIISSMAGATVSAHTFKVSSYAVNMKKKIKITNGGESVLVDNALLFQRLTAIALCNNSIDVDIKSIFSYSLCAYPASLASSQTQLLKANKPKLLEDFLPFSSPAFVPIASGTHVVVDGGFLIQNKVFWKKDLTFGDIACSTVS